MAKNLITGWEREKVLDWRGSGSVQTVKPNIDVQEFNQCIPHIISPIYGSFREQREYYRSEIL